MIILGSLGLLKVNLGGNLGGVVERGGCSKESEAHDYRESLGPNAPTSLHYPFSVIQLLKALGCMLAAETVDF